MREYKVQCPLCRQELEAPEDMMGTVVDCPQCRQKFKLPVVQRPTQHESATQGSPKKHIVLKGHVSDSPSSYNQSRPCPHCGESVLKVAIKCANCGSRLTPLRESGKYYEGIGRLGFWVLPIIICFVVGLVIGCLFLSGQLTMHPRINSAEKAAGIAFLGLLLMVSWLMFTVWLVASRMRNMGYSGWCSLYIFVPIVNLGVGLMCMCFPEGYRDTRKLDTVGWILIPVFIVQAVAGMVCHFMLVSKMIA